MPDETAVKFRFPFLAVRGVAAPHAAFAGVERLTTLKACSPAWISADSCRLYLTCGINGEGRLRLAKRPAK